MHLIGHLIFGAIVGLCAKFLLPGHDPGGLLVTPLIGIAGSWVGSVLGKKLGWYQEGSPFGFVLAVIGAMALLLVYRIVF
ncbi:MAG: GlsB/YeaQ/YmgE family stress response membrane protein [Steroidobacteraceae bacterium]|jgi:uncharacterized membrane protein YeaQ/YmgE (transglycosylase-associated protein family)